MAMQAKCRHCKTHFIWNKDIKLDRCTCPDCGLPLERTTHLTKFKVSYKLPVVDKVG